MNIKIINSIAFLFVVFGFLAVVFADHLWTGEFVLISGALILAYNCPRANT